MPLEHFDLSATSKVDVLAVFDPHLKNVTDMSNEIRNTYKCGTCGE